MFATWDKLDECAENRNGNIKNSVLYKTAQSSGIEMSPRAYFLFSGLVESFYHTRNVRVLKKYMRR